MQHIWKRILSSILALILVCGMLPTGFVLPAAAAEADINEMDALAALGIDTSVIPEDYDPNSTDNPYGKNNVTVQEVSELFLAEHGSTLDEAGIHYNVSSRLYGHNQALNGSMDTFLSSGVRSTSRQDLYLKPHGPISYYPAAISVAGNFDGNPAGNQQQVVTLGVDSLGDNASLTGLHFYITDVQMDGNTPQYAYSDREMTLITSKYIESEDMDPSSMFAFEGAGGSGNIDFTKDQYLAYNYIKAITGDFDGNGIDEIAVYVPNPIKSRIVIYRLETTGESGEYLNMDNWEIAYSYFLEDQYEGNPRYNAPSSNMVSLVTDDFNQDGTDDLAIAWGYYNGKDDIWNKETRAVLLYGSDDNNLIMEEQEIPVVYDGVPLFRTSIVQSDLNKDGEKELLMVGQLQSDIEKGNLYSRAVMIYQYTGSGFELGEKYNFQIIEDTDEDGKYDDEDSYPYYSVPNNITNVAAGRFEGLTGPTSLYVDSVLYQYGDDGLTAVARLDNNPGWNPEMRYYTEFGGVHADHLGVGREAIYTQQYFFERDVRSRHLWFIFDYWKIEHQDPSSSLKTMYKTGNDLQVQELKHTVLSDGWGDTGLAYSYCPLNTDNDTAYLRYTGERYLTYSDPNVLAVIASPPYFRDLSGDHLSGKYMESATSYTDSSAVGAGNTHQSTLTIGAYTSFEQEVSVFGVKVAQMEASMEFTSNFTYEYAQTKTMRQSVTYGTSAGMDAVAFYSIPLEVYVYDAVTPDLDADGNVIGHTRQKMSVSIPHKARVVSMDLNKYESIAKDYAELPQISGTTLTHTVGDPASYPSSARGYNHALVYGGDAAGVDCGLTGWVSQELEVEEEEAHNFVISQTLEGRVGAGAFGLTLGVIAGGEFGSGHAIISTEGSTYTGEIYNMPPEAEGYGYDYIWRLFTFVQENEKGDFPVVSYLVEECTAPPALPVDFAQDMAATTDRSVDLTWSYTGSLSAFKIYRYYSFPEGSGNYEIASVNTMQPESYSYDADGTRRAHYRFTDRNLQPYTEYQYVIQSVGTGVPTYSIPSKTLTARTKTAEGYPELRLSFPEDTRPEDAARNILRVYPDKNATVGVIAENSDRYPQGFTYQWQKYNEKSASWEDINAATYSGLTFRNTGVSDAGQYRCRVNTVYRGDEEYYITTYTEPFTLEYSLRTAELYDFTVEGGATDDEPVRIRAAVRSAHTNHNTVPMDTVSFRVESASYRAVHHGQVAEDGTVSLDLTLPQGYYTIEPYYPGNRVFKSASLEPANILVGSSGYQMVYEDEQGNEIDRNDIYFGDLMYFQLYRYDKLADGSLQKSSVDMTDLAVLARYHDGYINHKYLPANSGGGDVDMQFPEQAQEAVPVFSAGNNELFMRLYLDENGEIIPIVLQGLDYVPARTPTVTLDWTDDFYAKPRPVTIRFRQDSYTSETGAENIQLPDQSDLLITGLEKGIWSKDPQDRHENIFDVDFSAKDRNTLRLVMNAYTTAGIKVSNFDSSETIPGKYYLKIEAGSDTAASVMRNYDFKFIPGIYYVTGSLHNISLESRFEGAAQGIGTPGTVSVLSPESLQTRGKCSVGTEMVFTAQAFAGYELMDWEVNGVPQNTSSSIFACTMLARDTTVTAVFRLKQNRLQFLASPDYGGTVTEQSMTTGGIVANGYPLKFTAVPKEGYVFQEWQVLRAGIASATSGKKNPDGSSVLETVMGDSNMTVTALFRRDAYELTLSQGLQVRYLDDVDGLAGTPDEEVIGFSGTVIPGGTQVSVMARPGYRIAEGAVWTVNGEEISVTDDCLTFTMTEAASVAVATVNEKTDLTVTVQGPGESKNAVITAIDGHVLETPESFLDIPGGTQVSFEAVAAYGYRFEKWQIDGQDAGITRILTIPALDHDTQVTAVFTDNTLYHIETAPSVGYGKLYYSIPAGDVSGEVNPQGDSIPVFAGADICFTAEPAPLKMVDFWTLDGKKVYSAATEKTLTDLQEDHTLAIGFKDMVYFDVTFDLKNGAEGQSLQLQVNDDQKLYPEGTVEAIAGGSTLTFSVTGPESGNMVKQWYTTMFNGITRVLKEDGHPIVTPEFSMVLSGNVKLTAEMEPVSFREIQLDGTNFTVEKAEFIPDLRADDQQDQLLVRKGGKAVLRLVPEDGFAIIAAECSEFTEGSVSVDEKGVCTCTIPAAAYTDEPIVITVHSLSLDEAHLICFDTAGGSAVEPVWVKTNETVAKPADPVKKDMVFGGWYVDSLLTQAYDFQTPVTQNLNLYAKWLTKEPMENPFTDIDDHWAKNAILYCTERGLFAGVTKTEFGPQQSMSRAMLVAVLYRLEGRPEAERTHPFTDVPQQAWYADAVAWAYEQGVVSGISADRFAPNDPITREQYCVMIANYAKTRDASGQIDAAGLEDFDDYDQISTWALPGMRYCYSTGLLKGDMQNMLHPREDITRAEGAAILMRYLLMKDNG